MSRNSDHQTVAIDPISCYRQALELVQGHYWPLVAISAAGMLIGGAVPIVLIGPMMCGIYMCFLELYRGREFAFELLFKGFDLFVPSLIASLILTAISLLVFMPVFFIGVLGMFVAIPASIGADGGQAAAIAPALISLGTLFVVLLLFIVLIVVVSMFFMFTFPLIVDRGLDGLDALRVSARAVASNFGGVLGLTLIGVALGLVSVLACYVGTFLVMPISFAAMTIAYRKVFPELPAESAPPAPGPSG